MIAAAEAAARGAHFDWSSPMDYVFAALTFGIVAVCFAVLLMAAVFGGGRDR